MLTRVEDSYAAGLSQCAGSQPITSRCHKHGAPLSNKDMKTLKMTPERLMSESWAVFTRREIMGNEKKVALISCMSTQANAMNLPQSLI
jgi:hypothetical protein